MTLRHLRVVNSFKKLWHFTVSWKFICYIYCHKSPLFGGIYFIPKKVLNSRVLKNNSFHQKYLITTFRVVFLPPIGSHSATRPGIAHWQKKKKDIPWSGGHCYLLLAGMGVGGYVGVGIVREPNNNVKNKELTKKNLQAISHKQQKRRI